MSMYFGLSSCRTVLDKLSMFSYSRYHDFGVAHDGPVMCGEPGSRHHCYMASLPAWMLEKILVHVNEYFWTDWK